MVSYTWDQVVAWLGLVVPLAALAWAAIQHVQNQKREQEFLEFEKFHTLMRTLGTTGESALGNMAVSYELRKFPQYSDLIIRALSNIDVKGSRADLLKSEFQKTIQHLETK